MNQTDIPILYEDDDIVCINKPPGLLSIRDGYDPLLPHVASCMLSKYPRLYIVHRLDRETSGVMVLAKNQQAHKVLNYCFSAKKIQKEYYAIVIGKPLQDQIEITSPLLVNGDRKHRTIISEELGKAARTVLIFCSGYNRYSLVKILPYNGYTHQIRAHLASINLPILSDLLYQTSLIPIPEDDQRRIIQRIALHAARINLPYPAADQTKVIEAPFPDDFRNAMERLNLSI